jgi:hypothetical protein
MMRSAICAIREIMGNVDGGGMNWRTMSLMAASTWIWVVTSSAVVGSSKTIRSPAGHGHGRHRPLQLAAGDRRG